MIDISVLPIASIVSTKKKKATSNVNRWKTLHISPRLLEEVRVSIVRERAYRHDWLAPCIFEVDPFKDSDFGYFAVTLTIDRERSCYVRDGKPDYEKTLRGLLSKMDKEICYARKKDSSVKAVDAVGQLDLHANGFPHVHYMFVLKSSSDLVIFKKIIDWWEGNHGGADIQKLGSADNLARWMHYIFRDQAWHKNPPNIVTSQSKNLGFVRASGIPKILSTTMVVTDDKDPDPNKPKKTKVPVVVQSGDEMHSICAPEEKNPARNFSELDQNYAIANILKVSGFGPFVTFGLWLKTALRLTKSAAARQVLVDRVTATGLVEAFVKVWGYSKVRAIRYLTRQATRIGREWAWKAVETLDEMGYRVGFRFETTQGFRTEWDRNLLTLQGIRALTTCELRTKIESRVA